jgi:hypothetical protein
MMRFSKLVFAFLFAVMFYAGNANAQTRTWVSGVGDDVNPCSRTAPCKTFAGAISRTAAGGEINCLDPGGFGTITITKSITIDCSGTFGSILSSGTTGIIVNDSTTPTPGTIRVILRGLTINGTPPTLPGINGIRYISGASLTIENVFIENFTAAQPERLRHPFPAERGPGRPAGREQYDDRQQWRRQLGRRHLHRDGNRQPGAGHPQQCPHLGQRLVDRNLA